MNILVNILCVVFHKAVCIEMNVIYINLIVHLNVITEWKNGCLSAYKTTHQKGIVSWPSITFPSVNIFFYKLDHRFFLNSLICFILERTILLMS